MTPQRIIWHHSAVRSREPQFEQINQHHKMRDFPRSSLGFYVGYHWLIETDGTVRQARLETEMGAHDTGENVNSLGICFAGDFTASLPGEAQADAAARLIAGIRSRWNIPITRIEPHRWDDNTQCPGTFVPDDWLIKEYLKRETSPLHRLFLYIGELLKLI